jgi:hypothetical protein
MVFFESRGAAAPKIRRSRSSPFTKFIPQCNYFIRSIDKERGALGDPPPLHEMEIALHAWQSHGGGKTFPALWAKPCSFFKDNLTYKTLPREKFLVTPFMCKLKRTSMPSSSISKSTSSSSSG